MVDQNIIALFPVCVRVHVSVCVYVYASYAFLGTFGYFRTNVSM